MKRAFSSTIIAFALALTGCGSNDQAELDKLDSQLAENSVRDPAVAEAIESPIMVDPNLAGQSNDHAIRPANQPSPTPLPAGAVPEAAGKAGTTLSALAAEQARISQESFAGCQMDVSYSLDFAASAPADLPIHPKGQVSEAAGSNTAGCKLRALSYVVAVPPSEMGAYYADIAKAAGYTAGQKAEGNQTIVTGKRANDGGAFYAIIQPAGTGASVDFVANNGR